MYLETNLTPKLTINGALASYQSAALISFIFFVGNFLSSSPAARTTARQPRQPEILDPALAPSHKPFASRSKGDTAAGVEQVETWAVVEDGAQQGLLEQTIRHHELLQHGELLHRLRDEFLAGHHRQACHMEAPQRRRSART
jgi:hypothetical protein